MGTQGAGRAGVSTASPAHSAAPRARDSQLPGTGPASGVGSAQGWSWQAPWSCLHSFLSPFIYLLFYCLPPSCLPPEERSAAQVLSGATGESKQDSSPSTAGAKVILHHQQQPIAKASYSKWAALGCPSVGVPCWDTEETDLLTRRALWQVSLQRLQLSNPNPLSLWQTRAEDLTPTTRYCQVLPYNRGRGRLPARLPCACTARASPAGMAVFFPLSR